MSNIEPLRSLDLPASPHTFAPARAFFRSQNQPIASARPPTRRSKAFVVNVRLHHATASQGNRPSLEQADVVAVVDGPALSSVDDDSYDRSLHARLVLERPWSPHPDTAALGGHSPLEMQLLGSGASGRVFGCVGGNGRRYALKRVCCSGEEIAKLEASMHRQAGQHPNVLRLFHSWEEEATGGGWVATLLLERCRCDLWTELGRPRRAVPVALATRARWTNELCEAVAHCHARGVLHRDVSPWNVFVAETNGGSLLGSGGGGSSGGDGDSICDSGGGGGSDGDAFKSLKLADFGLAALLPPLALGPLGEGGGGGSSGYKDNSGGSGGGGTPGAVLRGLSCRGAPDLDASALGSVFAAPELGRPRPGYGYPADVYSLALTAGCLWVRDPREGGSSAGPLGSSAVGAGSSSDSGGNGGGGSSNSSSGRQTACAQAVEAARMHGAFHFNGSSCGAAAAASVVAALLRPALERLDPMARPTAAALAASARALPTSDDEAAWLRCASGTSASDSTGASAGLQPPRAPLAWPKTLHLVRHGESEYNAAFDAASGTQGDSVALFDAPLTPRGREQASRHAARPPKSRTKGRQREEPSRCERGQAPGREAETAVGATLGATATCSALQPGLVVTSPLARAMHTCLLAMPPSHHPLTR